MNAMLLDLLHIHVMSTQHVQTQRIASNASVKLDGLVTVSLAKVHCRLHYYSEKCWILTYMSRTYLINTPSLFY